LAWFLRGAHRRISKKHDKGFYEIKGLYMEEKGAFTKGALRGVPAEGVAEDGH
jgi:hypothetical protein